jgi:hypothetical protein
MHSQHFDYYGSPNRYVDFDLERAHQKFIEYNVSYFESFFFDLAPLISIPLYQQHKSREYIYGEDLLQNLSPFEYESLANSMNPKNLSHSQAYTPNIYKTKYIASNKESDEFEVDAHAFRREKRVTYVNKLGGDGRMHTIPVYWYEYIPVMKETRMVVNKNDTSRFEYIKKNQSVQNLVNALGGRAQIFERGLLAFLVGEDFKLSSMEKVGETMGVKVASNSSLDSLKFIQNEILNFNNGKQQEGGVDSHVEEGDATEVKESEFKEKGIEVNSKEEGD